MGAERVVTALVAAVTVTTVCACGEARSEPAWDGSVDTLANGAVVVHNPRTGVWDETSAWSLREDFRLGKIEGDGPEVFGRITDFEVDRAGRLYVLDGQAKEVRVFDGGGRHVRTFGRAGEGPGEFGRPSRLDFDPEGRLWVVDLGNQRYSLYDTTGTLVEDRRRYNEGNVFPWPGTIFSDGRLVEVDYDFDAGRTYTLHAPDGELLDTLAVPDYDGPEFLHVGESSRVSAGVPFTANLHRSWDGEGRLWLGVSESYRIARTDPVSSDTLMIVEREYDPVPVTDAEKDAAFERLSWFREQGGKVDLSRFPDHHRAYQGFYVDDRGYLWVRPTTPRDDEVTPETLYAAQPATFDVFDDGGRYLGRIESGMPLAAPVIRGEHLYAVTSDDLGVNYLIRLKIVGR